MLKKGNWFPMPRYLLRRNAVLLLLSRMDLKGKRVLEIGYGSGSMLSEFVQHGAFVEGWDYSPEARRIASEILAENDLSDNVRLVGSQDELSGSYDYLFAFEVLEHIEDDEEALKAWLNLLAPGGAMMLSFPAKMSKWNSNDVKSGHFRRYEKQGVREMLTRVGATGITVINYGFPLNLVLDPLLDRSYRRKKAPGKSREELTKDSGVERESGLLFRILSRDLFLWPFYILQRWFWNTDLGSCYLVVAQKPEGLGSR